MSPNATARFALRRLVLTLVAMLAGLIASSPSAAERLYVIGQLSGPLRASLEQNNFLVPFGEAGSLADTANMAPILMTGPTASRLDDATARRLADAFRAGWPLGLVDLDVAAVNAVHRAARTGQVFKEAAGEAAPEAFGCVLRADGGYSQMRVYSSGDPLTQGRNRPQRAADFGNWLAEARRSRLQSMAEASPKQDSSSPQDDLTQIVSAWTDSPYNYVSSSVTGGQALYQCNVEVWQAHQVDTSMDFYYLEQNCNFSPQNGYAVRGKVLDVGFPVSINGADADWDEVPWSFTTTYCPGDGDGETYSACDYYNYATGYNVNLQPNSPNGSALTNVDVVVLEQENPPTTTESTTVTEGISYSISGQVVAGTTNSNVSLSAGVQISTSTSTVIPDVQVNNNSNTNSTNAQWGYVMQAVDHVNDVCTNSMYAPTAVQTSTFNPRQDMVWGVDASYRSMDSFSEVFDVALDFSVTTLQSTMYVDEKGTRNVTNYSDCNSLACSCEIVTNGPWTHGSGTKILSIPVPATTYDPSSAQ